MKYNKKQTIMILEDDEDLAEGISLSLNREDLEFVQGSAKDEPNPHCAADGEGYGA